MSKIGNIDDLFKSKLAGREVEYDPTAWEGAGAALDQRYRSLFWRKFLWVSMPLIAVGAALAFLTSGGEAPVVTQESTSVEVGAVADVTNHEDLRAVRAHDHEIENTVVVEKSNSEHPATYVRSTPDSPETANSTQAIVREEEPRNDNAPDPRIGLPIPTEASSVVALAAAPGADQIFAGSHNAPTTPDLRTMTMFGLPRMNLLLQDTLADGKRPIEFVQSELRKVVYSVEGGFVLATGYKNGLSKRERPSVGWHAAVQADYHIYPRVFLASGVGLIARGSLANDASFRLGAEDILIEPVQAIFLNVPLTVNYRVGARQSVGIGMQFNPLLTAWGSRTTTMTGESGSRTTYVMDKTGLSSFDMAAVLDYSCGISERLSITAHAQYGLFDMTDNHPASRVDDYNYLLRVGVGYMLLGRTK